VLLLVAAAFAGPSAAGTTGPDENGSSDGGDVLAVVNAGGGRFREVDDAYRLVLDGVVPRAVWFNDRPDRDAGSYTIAEFLEVFFTGDDPPNAALEVFDGPAAGAVLVVEIANPRYQERRARLVLDARVLGEDEVRTVEFNSHAERSTTDVPARFGAAALFVDDASGPCLATYWTFAGEIESMNGISCETAQAVLQAASDQHPENIGVDQYIYDFAFVTETWHALDQGDQAFFNRTDHDVAQSFAWYSCRREGC
jgi:hypothetical protein